MSDSKEPPKDEALYSKFEENLRAHLRTEGISDAAIDELLKGNSITSTSVPSPTPWPWVEFRVDKVYKDGKFEEIKPEETTEDD